MPSSVETLVREITTLRAAKAEHARKQSEATTHNRELETRRQALLAKIADGDEGARRDLRVLDGRKQELGENLEAHGAAIAKTDRQLAELQVKLARAERAAAIVALQHQITLLAPASNALETTLASVREKSAELFSATKGVAEQLRAIDPSFDTRFEHSLTSEIRQSIWARIEEMGVSTTEHRPTFLQRVETRLRAALAQLEYQALEGHIVPAKGERLYRTCGRVSGVRLLDLPNGSLIALRPEEAAEFVRAGALEEVPESDEEAAA